LSERKKMRGEGSGNTRKWDRKKEEKMMGRVEWEGKGKSARKLEEIE